MSIYDSLARISEIWSKLDNKNARNQCVGMENDQNSLRRVSLALVLGLGIPLCSRNVNIFVASLWWMRIAVHLCWMALIMSNPKFCRIFAFHWVNVGTGKLCLREISTILCLAAILSIDSAVIWLLWLLKWRSDPWHDLLKIHCLKRATGFFHSIVYDTWQCCRILILQYH